ncbi:MAG: hypothetical protein AAGA77_24470, partial [Bacteroidota bacterium]
LLRIFQRKLCETLEGTEDVHGDSRRSHGAAPREIVLLKQAEFIGSFCQFFSVTFVKPWRALRMFHGDSQRSNEAASREIFLLYVINGEKCNFVHTVVIYYHPFQVSTIMRFLDFAI